MSRQPALAGALLLLLSIGCDSGPAVAPVEGTITQDGAPLPFAIVEFQPDSGAPSYGETDQAGHYELMYQVDKKGALLGHHFVSVRTEGEVTNPETDMTEQRHETVPAKYNDETELEFDVEAGKNRFDIVIEGMRQGRR